ncbi:MAG TPA: hypothetical protein PLT26_14930 [Anaerolineaceae bacterium]|nr:hypothetical protein [Anaerolineaceae bacterium]
MSVLGSMVVKLGLDPSQYVEGMADAAKTAEEASGGIVSQLSSLGGTMVTGALAVAAAGITAVTAYLYEGISAAGEAELIAARLNRTLQNTGGVSGVTAEMIDELAQQYQGLTRFEDDTIASAAAVMARFDSISKDTFPRAMAISMDLAESLGIDLTQATLMTSKALAEPGVGLMRLKQAGATFSDEMEDMINAMYASGDVAGAQALILQTLEDSIGGTATAAGETFVGQWTIFKNVLGNIGEEMTAGLLPGLSAVFGLFTDLMGSPAVQAWLESAAGWFTALGDEIVHLVDVISANGLGGLFVNFEDGSNYLGGLFELFGMSEDAAYSLGEKINNAVSWIVDTFNWLVTTLKTNKAAVVAILAALAVPIIAFVYSTVIPAAVAAISSMLPIIAVIALVAAAAYVLYSAWESDWGGIRTFITDTWNTYLKPIFDQVVTWLQTNIPIAIQTVKDWFVNVFIPALQTAGAWIQENVIPVLSEIVTWLATNIPIAIQAVSDWWNNVLIPALTNVWSWIQTNLVPVFVDIYTWLATNIPIAIQAVSDFWTTVLLPAITAVWEFLNNSVFPLFQAIGDFFGAVFGVVVTALAGVWQNILLPAFTAVWTFLNDNIFPLFQAIGEFFSAVFNVVITAAAGLWQNVLQPALEAVWGFLSDNVFPLFEDLAALLSDTFGPVIEDVGDFLQNTFAPALDGVGNAIDGVIGWIQDMTEAIKGLELPDWLTPGSPTPWEIGLIGIKDAMRDLSRTALPELEASMALPDVAYGANPGSNTVNNSTTWNVNVSDEGSNGQILRELHAFQVFYPAG